MSRVLAADEAAIGEAAERIRAGRLVAFPTETVYRLGADATIDRAVAEIFRIKGRPHFNPLIVHVLDAEDAQQLVWWNETAEALAASFWPGALTLVLSRGDDSPASFLASAGMNTLAVRSPAHAIARRLLERSRRPIAAPSANRSGEVSPTRADHVAHSLAAEDLLILDGGACPLGIESTIIDARGRPALLRPGAIDRAAIEAVVGPLAVPPPGIHAPGQAGRHYATRARLRLNAHAPAPGEAFLAFGSTPGGAPMRNLSSSGDLVEAAAHLFAYLRELDAEGTATIAVAPIPERGLGEAINDRLRRAALGAAETSLLESAHD